MTATRLLKKDAPVGTLHIFERGQDGARSGAIQVGIVDAEAFDRIEAGKVVEVKSAPGHPKASRRINTLAGAAPASTYCMRVSSAGIGPLGTRCQPPFAPRNNGRATPCATQVGREEFFEG